MDLPVTSSGSGATRVVTVHGVLDSGRSFAAVADILESECHLVRYDRRGYASAVDAPAAPADAAAHMDDVIAVLDNQRSVLVGHSFGGVIAAGAAVRAPELVSALVLYESVLAWAPGWDDRMLRGLLWGDDPEAAGLRLMFGSRFDQMDAAEKERRRPQATAFVVEERAVRGETPPYDVAELSMPVVYGFGAAFRVDPMRELFVHTADVEFVAVADGDHHAHRTAPRAFADLVRRGIARASHGPPNRSH
jgi:pimeloyl-ACP methyl ester carboxylesterase